MAARYVSAYGLYSSCRGVIKITANDGVVSLRPDMTHGKIVESNQVNDLSDLLGWGGELEGF